MERMTINTGVRLTPRQVQKLEQMAVQLRTSKNRLVGLLIDSAEVANLPLVSVDLNTMESEVIRAIPN